MANKKNSTPAKIFTIGVNKKSAEIFFELLERYNISEVVDVRLYNNTQLAGFSKGTDLKFFLNRISSIEYRHDLKFTPSKELFKNFQEKLITWEEYAAEFEKLMQTRRIVPHILTNYSDSPEIRYCLLANEVSPANCHRRLVAEKFAEVFGMEIMHL